MSRSRYRVPLALREDRLNNRAQLPFSTKTCHGAEYRQQGISLSMFCRKWHESARAVSWYPDVSWRRLASDRVLRIAPLSRDMYDCCARRCFVRSQKKHVEPHGQAHGACHYACGAKSLARTMTILPSSSPPMAPSSGRRKRSRRAPISLSLSVPKRR